MQRQLFELFNEIGIIAQLSRTLLENRLPAGLALPHFSVLNHLVRLGDGRTPGDLARAFQTPRNSMTNTLAGLEKRGFIESRPNEKDARSRFIFLTPAGRAFRESAIDMVGPDIAALAGRIPAEDVEAALPLLRNIRQVLDENRTPKPARTPGGAGNRQRR